MTVTPRRGEVNPAERLIDLEAYWSIVLAVAQWRRHAGITSTAIVRLRGFGVPESELLARRRATSADPQLAAVLRLAVTFIIARGRLEPSDLRRVERLALTALVPSIETYAPDALAFVDAAGPSGKGMPPMDLDVGDY